MKEITLKEFLIKNNACKDGFDFAKNLTLKQFLNTCQRGDWILWLFAKTNPNSLRELTLAKEHCANTVRQLMEYERSTKAVDVAISFGKVKATIEELDNVAASAYAAASADAAASAAFAASAAKKQNQKLTADICRKYLPIQIWNQI